MKVKVEIEATDGAKVTVFDESVSEEWQLVDLATVLKAAYELEKKLSNYVDDMPEEIKVKAEGVKNRG